MGFFDFLAEIRPYSEEPSNCLRMNKRHRMIVEPFRGELADARVLDLAAHDGRWSYALADAGAAQVIGVEGRQELIDRFESFPETGFKSRVQLRQGDIFEALEGFIATGERFDVVAVYGIFYHIMDHFRLLKLIRETGAKVILIDSEFAVRVAPVIDLVFEDTSIDLCATPQVPGQARAVIGIPSFAALDSMARALDFDVIWTRSEQQFADDRKGIQDYFRPEKKRRAFCTLVRRE
ncbi:MAG: class I SAM-dependent methyltransferase [Rhodobacteraceae bacterium]|nr:class I SAM-dependent methyltransferase [Paracoccaceae bacterium]